MFPAKHHLFISFLDPIFKVQTVSTLLLMTTVTSIIGLFASTLSYLQSLLHIPFCTAFLKYFFYPFLTLAEIFFLSFHHLALKVFLHLLQPVITFLFLRSHPDNSKQMILCTIIWKVLEYSELHTLFNLVALCGMIYFSLSDFSNPSYS